MLLLIILLLISAFIIFFFFKNQEWYSALISLPLGIIPIISLIASWVYFIITSKELSPTKQIQSFLETKKQKKLKKLGYSETEYNHLNEQLATYKQQVVLLNDELQL